VTTEVVMGVSCAVMGVALDAIVNILDDATLVSEAFGEVILEVMIGIVVVGRAETDGAGAVAVEFIATKVVGWASLFQKSSSSSSVVVISFEIDSCSPGNDNMIRRLLC